MARKRRKRRRNPVTYRPGWRKPYARRHTSAGLKRRIPGAWGQYGKVFLGGRVVKQRAAAWKKKGAEEFRPRLAVVGNRVYATPYSGAGYLVNPRRSKMAKKKYRRNQPLVVGRRKRSYRRNPALATSVRKAFSVQTLAPLAQIGTGFVVGIKAQPAINRIEFLAKMRRFTGFIPVAIGTFIAAAGKGKLAKNVGTGLGLAGLYDLVSQNIPQLKLMTVEGLDIDMAGGYDDGINGIDIDMDGEEVEVVGEDEDTVVVGEDDSDNPYLMV